MSHSATRVLHLVARVAIRVVPPRTAKRVIDRLARMLPPISDEVTARETAEILDRSGTCLSRAIALAALMRDAEVVIGVNPGAPRPYFAHAWVEVGGHPLRPTDAQGSEIGRMSRSDLEP